MLIENLLPNYHAKKIHDTLMSREYSWNWSSKDIVNKNGPTSVFQLCHRYMRVDDPVKYDVDVVEPIIYYLKEKTNIKIKQVRRIKANLIPRTFQNEECLKKIIHQDIDDDFVGNYASLIYYVHDCDGDTFVYKDDKETITEQVTPIFNNAVLINSKTWHRSSIPIENKRRVVINFVFEVESLDIKLI